MPRAAKNPANAKPRAKKANGYMFPEKLPLGELLTDSGKKDFKWELGPSIGKGGFGEIYSARPASNKSDKTFPYVIKIEPHENGPLFVEQHFYMKFGKPENVKEWKAKKKLSTLGIPTFHGFGSHTYNNIKYRFLVIEKYGKDLWSIFLENNKLFNNTVVYKCALQVIDALEYIHSQGYVHADIKGANLLLGLKKGTENSIYLVDFGLACKYMTGEYKRDPKRAHNGTAEYTSRDWHMGLPTRRGDLEILGYNLLQWVTSSLPWEGCLTVPERVQEKKEELMASVSTFIEENGLSVPEAIVKFLDYVSKIRHDAEPNYDLCREIFIEELSQVPHNGKLDFSTEGVGNNLENKRKVANSPKKAKRQKAQANKDNQENLQEEKMEVDSVEKTKAEKEPAPKRVSRTKKAVDPKKPTWRDAPAIIASNVTEPGVYHKRTTTAKKVVRRKKELGTP